MMSQRHTKVLVKIRGKVYPNDHREGWAKLSRSIRGDKEFKFIKAKSKARMAKKGIK